ncbi:MAG: hypothetical protein K2P76_07020 [Lachnospiraceae bacterium]|nr:hypothetical protein [Lachnospiraceae bacterium]MDE6980752.1 hypothetical protein [Lachnospiraceae bacterium]
MSQVIKTFTGVFFMLLVLLLGTGILSAQMDASNAINYKADIVAELENSNYSPQVLNGCMEQAIDNGYKISVKTFTKGGAVQVYTAPTAGDTRDVVMAEVVLTYPYRIGFLDSHTQHQVRGFAR